jgi:hypothetical protein
MATRAVRFRVHAGHLEPLDPLPLAEGAECTMLVTLPDAASDNHAAPGESARRRVTLPIREGRLLGPIRREDIYADVG